MSVPDILERKLLDNVQLTPGEVDEVITWVRSLQPASHDTVPLVDIVERVRGLEARINGLFRGQSIVQEISQISDNAGLLQAGEFRSGNGATPGAGFTGGRFGWPGFAYGSNTYFLAGVLNDVLQVGLSLTDGKIYAGAGNITIDSTGITILGDVTNTIRWTSGGLTVGGLFGMGAGALGGVALEGYGGTGFHGYAGMIAYESTARVKFNSFNVYDDIGAQLDFTNTTGKGTSARGLVIKDEISASAFSTILYLDMYRTVAAAANLGAAISWRAENSSSALVDMAYAGARWSVATAGSEDAEFPIALKVNGAMKEVVVVGVGGIVMNSNFAGIKTDSRSMATDTAINFLPARLNGMIIIGTSQGGSGGIAQYNVAGPNTNIIVGGANFAATTGVLTGTTGGAGKLTVSAHATNSNIYIENRTGGTRTIYFLLI